MHSFGRTTFCSLYVNVKCDNRQIDFEATFFYYTPHQALPRLPFYKPKTDTTDRQTYRPIIPTQTPTNHPFTKSIARNRFIVANEFQFIVE